MVNWRRGYICPRYMYILLYVKLIQCSGVPSIYGQLEEWVHLPWVYVHSSICRVPTAPGKPGKMMKAFPVMEISWNFEILQNIMEK